MRGPIRIGTRGSQLALWQARAVAARLEAAGVHPELVVVRTAGDRLQDAPLSEAGSKRLFVKELEDALFAHQVDLAVHSAKDLPAVLPDGLALAATLPRDDPRDALVLPAGSAAADVRSAFDRLAGGSIGTSSVRRIAQLAPLIAGARFGPVRGNVDTRLRKLDDGGFDALVLASAGLRRLGLAGRISAALPPDACVPAPGQGIIAVEIRSGDTGIRPLLRPLHDDEAGIALAAEQRVAAALGGGCQLPLGVLATIAAGRIDVSAVVCTIDGSRAIRARATGSAADAETVALQVARELTDRGAADILDRVRAQEGPIEGSY